MKKILVLGSPGVGKSFFSKKLSDTLNIKVYHLDDYYWKENWQSPAEDEWRKILLKLLSKDKYIIDGNYIDSLQMRTRYADTIIYIDSSIICALIGVIRRILKNIFLKEELPKEIKKGRKIKVTEKGILPFLWYVIIYNVKKKKKVLIELRKIEYCDVYVLRKGELGKFIESLM